MTAPAAGGLWRTPDALQDRVSSVFRLLGAGLQPVSLVLTGVLLERTGVVATVVRLFVPQVALALAATRHPALAAAAAPPGPGTSPAPQATLE